MGPNSKTKGVPFAEMGAPESPPQQNGVGPSTRGRVLSSSIAWSRPGIELWIIGTPVL